MPWRWCVALAVLLGGSSGATLSSSSDNTDNVASPLPTGSEHDDYLLKQVVWKRCYRKISPACLKLNLVRTVELMSKDSSLSLIPGVYFSSNSSELNVLPPDIARSLSSEHAPLDDLVAFTVGKYLRSLTLNVNIVDFVSGGNETLQRSVIDAFSGRARKNGLMGGYGAIAAMMGGMMASMMMAALAALAGKAMMTSMLALAMSMFAAVKGGGGGGGSKTYEVITKPVVSHIDTHSSEVQHEHHGHYHKRSLELDGGEGSVKEPGVLEQSKRQEDENDELDVTDNRKWSEDEKVNDEKGSFNDDEYSLNQKSKENEERDKDEFPTEEKHTYQRRSIDFNHKRHPRGERYYQVQSSDEDYDRFKRGLEYPSAPNSKLLTSLSPEHPVDLNPPLLGHPRQNHKEYKRQTDDDFLTAFGLFR